MENIPDSRFTDRCFYVRTKLTFPDKQGVESRHVPACFCDRAYECHWILMGDKLRNLDNQRCAGGHSEQSKILGGGGGERAGEIDTARNYLDPIGRDAAFGQRYRDGPRDCDDGARPSVLPPRRRVAAESEIYAPSRNHRRARAHRCESSERHGVGRMRVNDLNVRFADVSAKPECGEEIKLAERRSVNDLEIFLNGSLCEGLAGTRGDDRDVAHARQTHGQPEGLSLSSTPTLLGVDMKHANRTHGHYRRLSLAL
jgi:hypothetical protein